MNTETLVQPVFRTWADGANRAHSSDFRRWTFFETNCLSELVKLAENGSASAVHSFVAGRNILLPGTVLSELSAAPTLAVKVPETFATAKLFLVPDVSKFFDCDLWNFIQVDRHPRNVLEAFLAPADLFSQMLVYRPYVEAVRQSKACVESEFVRRVRPDVGTDLDERLFLATVWHRINLLAQEWLNLEIPTADARPCQFPAFFTYYYAYYFRYIKSHPSNVVPNDFNDISNVAAAPYCTDFFTERTLAGILNNDVRGRIPPRPVDVARQLNRRSLLSEQEMRRAKDSSAQKAPNVALLRDTKIWTIHDLREQVATFRSGG